MQDTKLNTDPYFDDFDRSKNYQKVLFRPGRSVQTRELNTIQSILQNQIERFGQHVFKEGSIVIPGNVGFNLNYSAVLVQNLVNGISVEDYREALVGKTITGVSSGVKAQIVHTISKTESEKSTITFYVKYLSSGFVEEGVQYTKFKNNEVLVDTDNTPIAVTTVQNSTSYTGSVAYINPGVYFVRGFFVEVGYQQIILDQYGTKPSYKIGLIINESIVTSEDDETLFDNALGSTNYSAPGADRLKINLELSKQNLLITNDSNFIELLRLNDGSVVKLVEFSAYNELEKNLARRTFDESGSYTTKPYSVKIREALSNGENDGVYTANQVLPDGRQILDRDPTTDEPNAFNGNNYYALEISEGKAYVKGFEITNAVKQFCVVEKPRTSAELNNQGLFLDIGSYFKLDNTQTLSGKVNFGDTVLLKNVGDITIGEAKCLGLTFGYFLYVADVTIYTRLTLSASTHGFTAGDFITGLNSGASAIVESFSGANLLLRQVSGTFLTGEPVGNSRVEYTSYPTISAVSLNRLEDVRKIEKVVNSTAVFSSNIKLDTVSISGSSFTVSGTSVTGINTNFDAEITANSKLLIGNTGVEVASLTSSTVTLESSPSVSAGTYFNVFKLVCKLYTSNNGLTTKVSTSPVKETSDYQYDISVADSILVTGGQFTLVRSLNEVIDPTSLIVTSGTAILTPTVTRINNNTVLVTGISNSLNNTNVNIYFKSRVTNPAPKTKTKITYQKLLVDLVKNSTNTIYGTRITDRELSLKFPDVYKIHAIHEALGPTNNSNDDMFDTLVLNNHDNIVPGDIIVSGSIRARVIHKGTESLKVIYLSEDKFVQGRNLAILVEISTNAIIIGRFVRESIYGKYKNITDNYTLIKNDTEEFYRVSKLVRKSNRPVPLNRLIVVFDYLEHTDLTNNFYSADSYSTMDYSEIPYAYNKISYADLIDFRYYIAPSSGAGGGSGTLSSPWKETSSAFDYKSNQILTSNVFAYPNSLMSVDYKFYLGRIDKVFLNETGLVSVIKGADSLTPKVPLDSGTGLLLGTVSLPAYLKKISDATIKLENTRGYTMKDIGLLENRLSNVETYTSLNLLEVSTNNLNILDDEGRNRFKNGFVVDKFNTVSVADLTNPDYSASIDTDDYLLRPYPYVNNISFSFEQSESGTQKTGNLITLPYEQVTYVTQPYASRVENLNPFLVVDWVGNLALEPKKDVWYDTVRTVAPTQTIDLEGPIRFLFDRSGAAGDQWGAWRTTGSARTAGGTNQFETRTGVNNRLDVLTQTINTGDTINSVVDQKFVRSSIVELTGDSLKPSTKFNLFVDGVGATKYFYPKLLTGLTGVNRKFVVGETVILSPTFSDNTLRPTVASGIRATVVNPYTYTSSTRIIGNNFALNQTSQRIEYSQTTTILAIDAIRSLDGTILNPTIIGDQFTIIGETSGAVGTCSRKPDVYSNEIGNVDAFVLIPNQTFETGILNFSVSDKTEGVSVDGIATSSASSQFFAQGAQLNVSSSIVSVRVPEVVRTPISQNRTVFIADPPPAPAGRDPLAQSFFVDEEGGVFITSLDLFFYTKDDIDPVSIDIRTVENGIPTDIVVPFGVSTVKAADIKTSIDASVSTRFTFPSPVYLSDKTDYCFVVRSVSTKYYLWVSRLGETDVTSKFSIDKQPAVGVLFKSANDSTWTPDQYEDIKFTLNRAKFKTNTTYATSLYNNPVPEVKLISDPFKFTEDSTVIKVFQPNHGMHSSASYVSISSVVSSAQNGILNGDISNNTLTISINDLTDSSYNFASDPLWIKMNNQNISTVNPGFIRIGDEILSYSAITNNNTFTILERGLFGTTAVQHTDGSIVQCYSLNGVALTSINTTHRIHRVINLDEYEIVTLYKGNANIVAGGPQVIASRNIPYEVINPEINILTLPNTESNILLTSITGSSIGNTQQTPYLSRFPESIENFAENELTNPRIVASELNKTRYFSGSKGTMKVSVNMSTLNDKLSPILDIVGSSIITISNRINKEVDINSNLDLSSELLPVGGLHSSYITKKVSLENSSTSIRVLFDAIRRQGVDIKVFAKVRSDSSLGSFGGMNYVEIPSVSYPVSQTEKEYRGFEYEIKGLQEFKEWSIKVVLISNDQSNIPKIKNFRAIALAI